MLRNVRVLLAAVVVLAALGCGGGAADPADFAVYHLELALGPPGEEGEVRCGPPRACPGVVRQPAPDEVRYRVLAPPGLGEDAIVRETAQAHGSTVSVAFTAAGTSAFGRLTRRVARLGGRDQGWHHLAVVVGDEIVAFPEIDFDAYPDGIADAPGLSIAALDPADARELARRLRGG
jgi:hypothetical protein